MNIYVIDKEIETKEYIKKINNNRNKLCNTTILYAVLLTFFSKGGIIYSQKENTFLKILEKLFKIPYLTGKIDNIIEFENHYAKIRKYDIPVLMYHKFVEKDCDGGKIKLHTTGKRFELHLKILKLLGYTTITFSDLKKIGLQNRFYKKYIILTVDDGYKDNYDILFPILKKYNMKAVIFLVSDLTYNLWTVKSDNEKKMDLMNLAEILELHNSGLVEFGGHTKTHPSFHKISDDEAKQEIIEDKKITEEKIKDTMTVFAYPYGHRKESTKEIVKNAGYDFAVSTDTGTGVITEDLFDIRRTAIDKTSLFDFLRKISPGYLQYKSRKYKNKRR